jgi:hypothetical protein
MTAPFPLRINFPFTSLPALAFANTPYIDWNGTDAREALSSQLGDHLPANRLMYEGDHWLRGDGFIGPKPAPNDKDYEETMSLIELFFTSRNVIREVVARHAGGVVGKEPRWRFAPRRFLKPGERPTDQEIADIALIESFLTEWWDRKEVIARIQDAVANAMWSDRGPMLLRIPDGLVAQDAGVPGLFLKRGDLAGALDYIWPEAPEPETATVYRDPDTKREIGIVIVWNSDGTTTTHVFFLMPSETKPERTIHRSFPDATTVSAQIDYNYGGRLPMEEIRRPRIITQQILQSQKALNLALTMMPRAIVTSGFLERIILSAQLPGTFTDIKDASGRVIDRRFVPSAPTFGPNTTNYVNPIVIEEDDGRGGVKSIMSSPDVKYRDPTDPKPIITAKESHYQDILEECDQAHILIQSDATPSGRSREQARVEFEKSLNKTAPHVNRVGRWMLDTVLAMAEEIAGIPGFYTNRYRAIFECNIDTGPLTADEKRQVMESGNQKYRSSQSVMELLDVENPDAEFARIQAEGVGTIGQVAEMALAAANLSKAGFPPEIVGELVGLPPDLITKIVTSVQQQQEADLKKATQLAALKPPAPPPGSSAPPQ